MIRQLIRSQRRWILVDINTQNDLFLADGTGCIRNHRRVLANVRRMVAWARRKNVKIISTCQVFPNNNGGSEPNYCLEGTEGQKKIKYSLLNNRISFPADGSTDLPMDILCDYRQVILNKRCIDPFDEPRIERLLSEARIDNFILIGAYAEDAVKATALGLLQRGKKVTIVVDAVGMSNRHEGDLALRKMKAKGAKLIETKNIAGITHLKHVGACDCESCRGKSRKQNLVAAASVSKN